MYISNDIYFFIDTIWPKIYKRLCNKQSFELYRPRNFCANYGKDYLMSLEVTLHTLFNKKH